MEEGWVIFMNDEFYFKDNFTKEDTNVNLDINKLDVNCINSKTNHFSIDEEGNILAKSILLKENTFIDFDLIYPIGSVYISVNDINSSVLFGGVWDPIKDRFLLASGDTFLSGSLGGEVNHTLSIEEMPSHSHELNSPFYKFSEMAYGFNGQVYKGDKVQDNVQNTSVVGGSQPHNNMPPYLVLNIWKRVA